MRFLYILSLQFFCLTLTLAQADTVFNQVDNQGRKIGYWKKYYENGKLMYKGFFKDNKPLGELRRYYESGGLQAILSFGKNNEKTKATLFYEDGELSAEGYYNKTVKDSVWKYYSYYTAALVSEESYVNGEKSGIQKSYYANGNLSEEIEFKNGYKDGVWNQYFEDGKKKLETTYQWNNVNGRYTFYYPTGTIYILGNFVDNKRHGTWTFYDEDGKEKYKLHYEYGVLDKEDEKSVLEKNAEYFKMVDENIGKFEEPSVEDFYNTGPF